MQSASIDVLLSGITAASSNANLVHAAHKTDLRHKFREAFLLFAKCHNTYNGKVISDMDINKFGTANYTPYVRKCLLACRS